MWSFKQTILWLHRWLGLIAGLVVLILSVTGCLYVFHEEINGLRFSDMYHVEPSSSGETLPLSELKNRAQEELDGASIYRIVTHKDPRKAWEFVVYRTNPDAYTYFGSIEEYRTAYLNPYTGEVTGLLNNEYEFFTVVMYLHWSLLLSTPIGQPIVGWSTVVFVLLLISGLILWWPRRWTQRFVDMSFKVKWRLGWRRLNYDLHNVVGFYTTLLALVLALTGMVWSFGWFESAVYAAGAGTTDRPAPLVSTSDTTAAGSTERALNAALVHAWDRVPEAQRVSVSPPGQGSESGVIRVSAYSGEETYYRRDELVYDRYSAELLDRKDYEDMNGGEKLLAMNYDIHVGSIGGLPGKILAFLVSLVCASLPITGFIVWFDRESKKWSRYQGNGAPEEPEGGRKVATISESVREELGRTVPNER